MACYDLSHQHRQLVKCVDVKRIRDWVPEMKRRRVDLTTAWEIIQKHYCGAIVARGVCPIQCDQCREDIVSMFDLTDARSPEALLTWTAKDRSAKKIETLIVAQKTEEIEKFPTQETGINSLFPNKKKQSDNLFIDLAGDYK